MLRHYIIKNAIFRELSTYGLALIVPEDGVFLLLCLQKGTFFR
ncbi:hypothetical protein SUBVAR_07382 [Subdoligranulum variabile DSM 15176]|uniref:Uncharacterized protein n=1 Tax=Subdoligranulum variabile DSM 15176 TaxID=411471 RepID=D1PSJ9_9FIRM|nr:hypothetical protein SUBVAR_07382 [Subdoligranulum variabile DSM 15176]